MSAPVKEGHFYMMVSLKASQPWADLKGRLTNKPSNLAAGEVAIKLDVSVPMALFKRPILQAKVTIPENAAIGSAMIDATVLDNIRVLIEQQTGLDIQVSLVEPVRPNDVEE